MNKEDLGGRMRMRYHQVKVNEYSVNTTGGTCPCSHFFLIPSTLHSPRQVHTHRRKDKAAERELKM